VQEVGTAVENLSLAAPDAQFTTQAGALLQATNDRDTFLRGEGYIKSQTG
jgi:hypothetical protein